MNRLKNYFMRKYYEVKRALLQEEASTLVNKLKTVDSQIPKQIETLNAVGYVSLKFYREGVVDQLKKLSGKESKLNVLISSYK